jgi:hypothetical protein
MTAYSPIDIADDTIIVVNAYATLPLRAFLAHHGLDRAAGENIMRALADSRAYQGAIGYVPHCKLTLLADKFLEFQ